MRCCRPSAPAAEASKSIYYRALIDRHQILLDKDKMTETQRIEALEGYLKKYATHQEVSTRLGSLLELYPYQRLRRARFLESVIQRVTGLTPEMRKQLGGRGLSDAVTLSSYRGLTIATSIG